MRTLRDILLTSLNLVLPYLIINLLMIIDFFISGSGMGSEANYEKYKFIWISVFALFGLLQLFLVYKYFIYNEKFKYILLILIFLTYGYIGYNYF